MDGPKAKMTDENDEETEEICEQGRTYVTRICEGKPSFDDGKYHNHCHQCPGFGMCIGDYRYLSFLQSKGLFRSQKLNGS